MGEYPDLPRGFRRHLDVAFFSVTTEELLNNPTAGDEVGQRLVATKIPEPTSVLGLPFLIHQKYQTLYLQYFYQSPQTVRQKIINQLAVLAL